MDTLLLLAGVLVFLTGYGWLAATVWWHFTARHIARLRAGIPDQTRDLLYPLACCSLVAVLPPTVFFFLSWHLGLTTSDGEFALLIVGWVVSAVPGVLGARRLMRAAGIDPDAGG